MHSFSIPADLTERVIKRAGRAHPFDTLVASKTAFVVVDMQNYFVHPDYQGAVPMAQEIVPNINRLAAATRAAGGHVIWIKNATNDTRESWSVFHDWLMTSERRDRRYETMDTGHEGHALWPKLDARPEDAQIVKKRFSAFIQGSSNLAEVLREHGLDTVLVTGTVTNVCCESTARDAMMLNFKTIMVTDGNAAVTDQDHNAALCAFYLTFGDIMSTDMLVTCLERNSRRDLAAAE